MKGLQLYLGAGHVDFDLVSTWTREAILRAWIFFPENPDTKLRGEETEMYMHCPTLCYKVKFSYYKNSRFTG